MAEKTCTKLWARQGLLHKSIQLLLEKKERPQSYFCCDKT